MSAASIIVKALGGSITGYITNDLAIKMLFRKYGPLGGVILETKSDFISNISKLVEREIINHNTIEDELAKDEFRDVFKTIIDDILEKYLYENTDNISLKDIPELDQTFDNFINFYEKNKDEFLVKLSNPLFDNLLVEDLLGEDQIDYLANHCLDATIDTLEETNTIYNLVSDFYYENGNQEVANFISPRIFRQISINLKDSINDFHNQLEIKFESQIDNTIDILYEELDVTSNLIQAEEQIKKKTFTELLGRDNTDNISNELLERTVRFLKSNEGIGLITKFLEDILGILKRIDISLLELLNEDLRANLEYFMERELPAVVEQGIRWIKRNKREIEDLIEEAATETLESGGIKNWIKKNLKDIFMGNIAREFEIINKIITELENGIDIKKLSKEITNEIISYIKNNSIGEIITYLESKKLIKIKNIARLIDNNIEGYVSKLDLTRLDTLFETEVGDVLNVELKKYFEENIKGVLIKKFKDEFLFNERLTRTLQVELADRILKIVNLELQELIPSEYVEDNLEYIKSQVLDQIKGKRGKIIAKITQTMDKFIANKRFSELISDKLKDDIITNVGDSSSYYLQDKINELRYQEVVELYDKLNKNNDLAANLTNLILDLVNKNLSVMIEGKIESAVADNLSKLPDEQIQGMLEQFMGTELKPITILGSILGTGAAIGLYFGQDMVSNLPTGVKFSTSIFAYGLVGYLTNIIALKMIFRPYEEKKFLGMEVPFTPGVITKKKPDFAESMANFVDKELLNPYAVDNIFKSKRNIIGDSFKESISLNNYQLLEDILKDNNDFISQRAFNGVLNYVDKNQKELVKNLIKELQNFDLAVLDSENLESELKRRAKDLLLNSDSLMTDYLSQVLNSQYSLNEVMPESLRVELAKELEKLVAEKVREGLELIGDERKLNDLIKSYSNSFDEIIEKQMNDLISNAQQRKLKQFAKDHFLEVIRSTEIKDRILELIEERFLKEVHPKQKIGTLFDGRLMNGMRSNTDFLIDQLFTKCVNYLQSERGAFKSKAVDALDEAIEREKSSGFFGRIKGSAKGLIRSATDADDTIREVIDNLVDYKFPKFLKDKEEELSEVVDKFLLLLERRRIGDIGVDLDKNGIRNVVDSLIENDALVNNLIILLDGVIDSILEVRLKSLLRIVSINNLVDILDIFENEIDSLKYVLSDNIYSKDEVIIKEINNLLQSVFEELILSIEINELTQEIASDDVNKSVDRILKNINSSQAFNDNLSIFINDSVTEIKYDDIDELIDFSYLQKDIQNTLKRFLSDNKIKDDLAKVMEEITVTITDSINYIIEKDTKDFVLDIGFESSLDSIEDNFLELMNSVNIKDVTEKEINNMNPKEIEKLFNSFAAQYFRKLEFYGWMGGGIGLASEIAVLLGTRIT